MDERFGLGASGQYFPYTANLGEWLCGEGGCSVIESGEVWRRLGEAQNDDVEEFCSLRLRI